MPATRIGETPRSRHARGMVAPHSVFRQTKSESVGLSPMRPASAPATLESRRPPRGGCMELVTSVAIGLNPFVGLFTVSGLAAFSDRWASDGPLWLLMVLALLAGAVVPVHLAIAYVPRFAPRVRRIVQSVAPVAGAVGVSQAIETNLPPLLAALIGAAGAFAVAWLVTTVARRASRSPAWVGLGHIPVLMAVTTLSACLVPLSVAVPAAAATVAALAVSTLLWASRSELRAVSLFLFGFRPA
jgi:hypothetical protein